MAIGIWSAPASWDFDSNLQARALDEDIAPRKVSNAVVLIDQAELGGTR